RDEASVAALMVRVPSVTPHALRLELPIVEANRTRDDGVELTWRMTGLERGFSEDPLPIFIECAMPMQHHPGRDEADHRTQPHGIAWVEFGADSAELGRWLGSHDLDIRVDEAASGPTRVGVSTADGEIVI
ncbi:MAG: VOC family protein, partial [Nitriliruptorales bacterium]|nr:VOC family protein [Nitriliruptorales bacterium]